MSFESFAILTAGRKIDFGATPSREQINIMDRMRQALKGKKRPKSYASAQDDSGAGYSGGREHLLGSLRGLSSDHTDLILYFYSDDESAGQRLLNSMMMKAVDLHNSSGWRTHPKTRGKFVIRKLTALAIQSAKWPNNRITDAFKARLIDVDYDTYRRHLKTRYDAIYRLIADMACDAESRVEHKIRKNRGL